LFKYSRILMQNGSYPPSLAISTRELETETNAVDQ
jgi:hypothetical protein